MTEEIKILHKDAFFFFKKIQKDACFLPSKKDLLKYRV